MTKKKIETKLRQRFFKLVTDATLITAIFFRPFPKKENKKDPRESPIRRKGVDSAVRHAKNRKTKRLSPKKGHFFEL